MAELDDETLEQVRRWCAEAGRQTGAAEIRAALAPLGWDELLHVRALLADPPPARPLGPAALADLARGTPADVAAEREREGRYAPEEAGEPEPPQAEPAPARGAGRPRRGSRRPVPPVVHRKRDQTPAAPGPSPAPPSLEELRLPSGRAVLEQLVRKHGARRSFLLGALAAWRRAADGAPPDDADLDALLDHHGLARAFAHRERDELLHALRAARGEWAGAATRVGLSPETYRAALDRVGATPDAERIREERRAELRARATLAERSRLLSQEAERLADLALLAEVESDLRARLPEHLRALRAGGPPGGLASAFARSVALPEPEALAVARRLGIDLGADAPPPGRSPRRPRSPAGEGPRAPRRPGPDRRGPGGGRSPGKPVRGRGPRPSRPRKG